MPLPLRFLVAGAAMLAMANLILAGDNLLPAPPNCASVKIGRTEYIKGEVYISGHEDTVMLKCFGFRNLQFVGRSLRSVKYFALWPRDLDVRALPDQVSGLNYDRPADEMAVANLEKSAAPEVRLFLNEIPEPWTAWPNISDLRGGAVNSGEWYSGGYSSANYYGGAHSCSGTRRTVVINGCGGLRCCSRTNLRPNDFGILRDYRRDRNGQLYRKRQ